VNTPRVCKPSPLSTSATNSGANEVLVLPALIPELSTRSYPARSCLPRCRWPKRAPSNRTLPPRWRQHKNARRQKNKKKWMGRARNENGKPRATLPIYCAQALNEREQGEQGAICLETGNWYHTARRRGFGNR